jgi:hypothetical protein
MCINITISTNLEHRCKKYFYTERLKNDKIKEIVSYRFTEIRQERGWWYGNILSCDNE